MTKPNHKRTRRRTKPVDLPNQERSVPENTVDGKPPDIQEHADRPPNQPVKMSSVRVLLVAALTGIILSVAFHTGFLGLLGLDDLIDRRFWGYADNYVDKSLSREIAIISIEEESNKNGGLGEFGPNWRGYHAKLINALSTQDVKAKVIAFDMYFEDASPANDDALGRAIQSAEGAGTKVILGSRTYREIDDRPVPQITQRLAAYLDESNWALLEIGGSARSSLLIGKVKLGAVNADELPPWVSSQRQQIIPSLPLKTVMNFWAGQQQAVGVFDIDNERIDVQTPTQATVRSIPVTSSMDFTFDIADKNDLANISYSYHEVFNNLSNPTYLRSIFGGKIVIVGVRAKPDFRSISPTEKQYGMEILAGVTSNLVQEVHIKPLSNRCQYTTIFLMSFIGALLPTLFGNYLQYRISIKPLSLTEVRVDIPLAVGAACLLYLLIAFFIYVDTRKTMAIQYDLVGLIAAFTLLKVVNRHSQTSPSLETIS